MSATLLEPVETALEPRPYRWSWDRYMQAAAAGAFDGRRVMLIDGEVLQMSPMNDPHAHGIVLTYYALSAVFGAGFTVRVQMPMRLLGAHDPEPDVLVLAGGPRSNPTHPTSALLVVEVADSSFDYDTQDKANLYAAAGIADYWVVDVAGQALFVFRDPTPEPSARFGHTYRNRSRLGPTETASPLAAPTASVRVADLLP